MLYLEDFSVGQTFVSREHAVDAAAITAFAAAFDPQPFHLDDAAARGTLFGGLAASGWHTGAMVMRLMVETVPVAGGIIGSGLDELKWPHPVRPGDRLHVVAEVIEVRPSKSRPDQGWVKLRATTFNQAGTVVMVIQPNLIVPRKPGETA